ncbi:YraN family protein [Nocardioides alkalitolerans]|uniref:YraN family protein n=1 Tax=Nocardioides alkalitolerans TaxID=281714 RepID=UPI000417BBCC|nr:YraN family protein [Nocardioides alkalitolerans]
MTDPIRTDDPAGARADDRRGLGRYGEQLAVRHLTAAGLVLLDQNWRCDAGEIDLVLREGRVLVICEVKTRTSTAYGEPLAAVTPVKLQRLRRLGARWMAERGVHPPDVRIDMVGIVRPRTGAATIEHVRGLG